MGRGMRSGSVVAISLSVASQSPTKEGEREVVGGAGVAPPCRCGGESGEPHWGVVGTGSAASRAKMVLADGEDDGEKDNDRSFHE